ncbi:MAG TPA: winged helix-turn-helix domain-containing protein [Thermoanaerobaculia bacterium]|nr:winged helix-turn-helix domain-containing protein [Thermoanaerobaculia bacterium]
MTASHPEGSGSAARPRLRFGDFELRLDSGELLRAGEPVKLQPQPAKVLEVLASRSGEVVSREEIRRAVWNDAFGDFDASLNFAIKEIRRALGDSAASPAFVETVPRRGYRFLIPVKRAPEVLPPPLPTPRWRPWSRLVALGCMLLLLTGSRLGPAAAKAHSAKPLTAVKAAHEAYLRGIYFAGHEKPEQAAAAFQEAILLDPGFAAAYAELAQIRLDARLPADAEATKAAARRALELDLDLTGAHLALAQVLMFHDRDWAGAGREIHSALVREPHNAKAHDVNAYYLASLGRRGEAIAEAARARELDPAAMLFASDYAWFLYLDHRYEEAIRQSQAALQLHPLVPGQAASEAWKDCETTILQSASQLGDRETALVAAKALLAESPGHRQEAAQLASIEDYWRGREQRIQKALQNGFVDPYFRAETALVLGDRDRALALLTEQCSPPESVVPFTAVEPMFDSLHADPRWPKVLDCLKLPASAPARRSQG